jgi:hypothetical protein
MCVEKPQCQKPQELIGKPEECTLEQIQKCHGEDKGHPCLVPENSEVAFLGIRPTPLK